MEELWIKIVEMKKKVNSNKFENCDLFKRFFLGILLNQLLTLNVEFFCIRIGRKTYR